MLKNNEKFLDLQAGVDKDRDSSSECEDDDDEFIEGLCRGLYTLLFY
jgi:hypothetical protein